MLRARGPLRPAHSAQHAVTLRAKVQRMPPRVIARSASSKFTPRFRSKPIDTPLPSQKGAANATPEKPRTKLRALSDKDILLHEEKGPLEDHLERQKFASILDVDLPTAVASEVNEAGSEGAPPNLSLAEAEHRVKAYLASQETKQSADDRFRRQALEVLKSLQRMIRFAREHKIDPAKHPTFYNRLKKNMDFLGLSSRLEAERIVEEDSSFGDVHELSSLQKQKLFFTYAKEMSDLSGVRLEGLVDPQGVGLSPAYLPRFSAADYHRTITHYRRTGKILISKNGEETELDASLAGVSPPSLEQLAVGFVLRLAYLLRVLREEKVTGDEHRTKFFIRATANMADMTASRHLGFPAITELKAYPGVLPKELYTRLISLLTRLQDPKTALELFAKCREVHNGADVEAWQLVLLLHATDRAEQTKLLNEMDKLGMGASEAVYEAVIAGHLHASDMRAANEALVAGRREGYKLNNAHTAWVAQQIALNADAASLYEFIRYLVKEGVRIDYDVMDQAFSYVKRAKLDNEAAELQSLRQQLFPDLPPPSDLVKMDHESRVLADFAMNLSEEFAREGRPISPPPPQSTVTPINIDNELLEVRMKGDPTAILQGVGRNLMTDEERLARKYNPEWFSDQASDWQASASVRASLAELPPDLAAKIRHIIDNTPPEQISDALRVLLLDQLDNFKQSTGLKQEIEAARSVLERATAEELASEDIGQRNEWLRELAAKGALTDEQVTHIRLVLQMKAAHDIIKRDKEKASAAAK